MSRILLVDDSPHAQRMGERILSDEGFEVVTVSNGDSALIRLEDVNPDVLIADAVMPGRTGYDLCQFVKMSPRHRHVRVVLTAGALEPLDEARVQLVQADGSVRKPFEATGLLTVVRPLVDAAVRDRPGGAGASHADRASESSVGRKPAPVAPFVTVVDAERVRAAVTVALDASMGAMVDSITERVLAAFSTTKPEARPAEPEAPRPVLAPIESRRPEPELPSLPAEPLPPPTPLPPPAPRIETVRRVNPLRHRSGSILGLSLDRPAPDSDPKE